MSDSKGATFCKSCENHIDHCACASPPALGLEVWFTPCDWSPSYRLLVVGGEITVLYAQDIWVGYEPASVMPEFKFGTFPSALEPRRIEILERAHKFGKPARRFPRVAAFQE